MDIGKDLTKRQQEIFDFIKKYSAQVRLSADGARHRQGGRARVVLDGPRPPGQPREGRPAAARSLQAARDRDARPRGGRGGGRGEVRRAPERPAARRPGRRGPADPRRGEHRGVRRRCPSSPAGTRASTSCAIRGESMKNAGILEGDFVVVRPQDTADRRRDRGRPGGRGGDRQALLPRGRPRPPAARERRDGADPLARGARDGQGRRRAEDRHMTATARSAPPRSQRALGASPTSSPMPGPPWPSPGSQRAGRVPGLHGPMQPRWSAGAGVVGGRCEDCGTTLE